MSSTKEQIFDTSQKLKNANASVLSGECNFSTLLFR